MFQIVLLMYSERDRCPVGRNSRFIDFYLTTFPIDPNIQNDKRIYVLLIVLNIIVVPNWTGACLTILSSFIFYPLPKGRVPFGRIPDYWLCQFF